MKKVVIVDYGLGNIFSLIQAFKYHGVEVTVSDNVDVIKSSDGIVLPGVGAFGDAMAKLKSKDLINCIVEEAKSGKAILGVCLGLQLLFSRSEEFGAHEGLNLIEGEVCKFPEVFNSKPLNVPFIGWNNLEIVKQDSLLKNLTEKSKMFLVHSFYVKPKNEDVVLARCDYSGFKYPALVRSKNIFGVQGHPEKSAADGLQLYLNWLNHL